MIMYRAKIYWKHEDDKSGYYNEYFLDMEFTIKRFAIKAIFDYFINQLFIEFIHYYPNIREKNIQEIKQNYSKFIEYIDDYQFKYVMDLEEMWNNKDKEGGYNYWIYEDLYDEMCNDEKGLFYEIEEFERY